MSVVAWDGKTLAADRMAGNSGLCFTASKITRLDDGTLLAITGTIGSARAMVEWYKDGADPAKYPKWQEVKDKWSRLIVVTPDAQVCWYEEFPFSTSLLQRTMAWGAGQDFAMGAMAAGADARRAVQITIDLCDSCGLGVDAFDTGLQLARSGD